VLILKPISNHTISAHNHNNVTKSKIAQSKAQIDQNNVMLIKNEICKKALISSYQFCHALD